jgi:hypothetical protein
VGDLDGLADLEPELGIGRLAGLGLGAPVGERVADLGEEVVEAVLGDADGAADDAAGPLAPAVGHARLAGRLPGPAAVARDPQRPERGVVLRVDADDELADGDQCRSSDFSGGLGARDQGGDGRMRIIPG